MIVIDKWLRELKKFGKTLNFSNGAMRYILWYAALLVLSCGLYLVSWGFDWYENTKPNMKALLEFLHEIASASWVAVIGFICKSFVDKDGNGIPDEFERSDDNGRSNNSRRTERNGEER